ncbi:MAG: ABC transporter permease [Lachnospiraceae bacterium]|nr:ABC transporter permease [Lachnospiraceae bacterium]MDD3796952.1 ABC transporter permease [Lachnospiraceae bacterium]
MDKKAWKQRMDTISRKYGIFVVFIVLIILGTATTGSFLTAKNITNVLRQIAVTGVLALAEMLLIISGNIDLSLGSVIALSGMFSVSAYLATGSLLVAFVVAIVISIFICSISGIFVAKIKLPSFIATMAMDYIARGLCYLYTGGQATYEIGDYGKISTTYVAGIPLPIFFFLGCAVICWIILNRLPLGRNIYAIGGNSDAAKASGINVNMTTIKTFAMAGLLTGIATVLQIARVNSAIPNTAENYHGDAIAAAVIGGTSFTGGIGTVTGCLVGACIMGFLGNWLNLIGLGSYFQMVTKGCIILMALSIDMLGKNKRIKKK